MTPPACLPGSRSSPRSSSGRDSGTVSATSSAPRSRSLWPARRSVSSSGSTPSTSGSSSSDLARLPRSTLRRAQGPPVPAVPVLPARPAGVPHRRLPARRLGLRRRALRRQLLQREGHRLGRARQVAGDGGRGQRHRLHLARVAVVRRAVPVRGVRRSRHGRRRRRHVPRLLHRRPARALDPALHGARHGHRPRRPRDQAPRDPRRAAPPHAARVAGDGLRRELRGRGGLQAGRGVHRRAVVRPRDRARSTWASRRRSSTSGWRR